MFSTAGIFLKPDAPHMFWIAVVQEEAALRIELLIQNNKTTPRSQQGNRELGREA